MEGFFTPKVPDKFKDRLGRLKNPPKKPLETLLNPKMSREFRVSPVFLFSSGHIGLPRISREAIFFPPFINHKIEEALWSNKFKTAF